MQSKMKILKMNPFTKIVANHFYQVVNKSPSMLCSEIELLRQ